MVALLNLRKSTEETGEKRERFGDWGSVDGAGDLDRLLVVSERAGKAGARHCEVTESDLPRSFSFFDGEAGWDTDLLESTDFFRTLMKTRFNL